MIVLSVATEPAIIQEQPSRRRGRPRKFATNAERQAGYNKRKRALAEIAAVAAAPVQSVKGDNGDSSGVYLQDAPHGKGLLISGGYDGDKIATVTAAHQRDESGRKVTPKGQGTTGQSVGRNEDSADELTETDNKLEQEGSFVQKQARAGAFNRPSKRLGKTAFKESVKRLFCSTHSPVQEATLGAYKDGSQWILLYEGVPDETGSTCRLECGCTRSIRNYVTSENDGVQLKRCA